MPAFDKEVSIINIELSIIPNFEQRQINVVYFNVDLTNVRQRWNNVVILNVDLHNVEARRNNVVNMTIKKMKISIKIN